jgi:hypothetical protein
MARGGFLLEYLAMKKSNNGWDFLKHLFYLFGAFILLSIYWSIAWGLISWLVSSSGYVFESMGIPHQYAVIISVVLVLFIAFMYGFKIEKLLLAPVFYVLDY